MTTLIICANEKCIHAKKRKDDLYQCGCTTIRITQKNDCDSYFILPVIKEISDSCVVCGYSPAEYTNGINSFCSLHKRYKATKGIK